jgi:predicted acyl esterase
MISVPASGIEPGQRRLNGPQTTGREYRKLSQPTHLMSQDEDVGVPMRDGINLRADVHRPAETRSVSRAGGRLPLSAADPKPWRPGGLH